MWSKRQAFNFSVSASCRWFSPGHEWFRTAEAEPVHPLLFPLWGSQGLKSVPAARRWERGGGAGVVLTDPSDHWNQIQAQWRRPSSPQRPLRYKNVITLHPHVSRYSFNDSRAATEVAAESKVLFSRMIHYSSPPLQFHSIHGGLLATTWSNLCCGPQPLLNSAQTSTTPSSMVQTDTDMAHSESHRWKYDSQICKIWAALRGGGWTEGDQVIDKVAQIDRREDKHEEWPLCDSLGVWGARTLQICIFQQGF